jgi:CheY-like chemotaxis protein
MKKVLIVDDDIDVREIITETLSSNGYEVEQAESGEEGWEKFESFNPDLVILDLIMESYDAGFILAYKLKKKNPDMPIIMATSVNRDSEVQFDLNEAKERQWIKADMFLDKPINPGVLLEKINNVLMPHSGNGHH